MDHCPSRATGAAAAALLIAAAPLPALAQASDPFLGQVMCAAFNFQPRGWAELNGQLLSIAQNTALFALLGTQYGGNGQTTFALPDMRGRAMLHAGQGPGLTLRDQGERAGAEAVSISVAQMPMHSHNVSPQASSSDGSLTSPLNAVPAGTKPNAKIYAPAPGNVSMGAVATSTTGTGAPVPTMSPYVTLRCFIALQGVFPSRDERAAPARHGHLPHGALAAPSHGGFQIGLRRHLK